VSGRASGGGGPGAEGAGGGVARSCLASRIVLLILGAVALLAGLTGSLRLLGVPMPPETAGPAAAHGLLMTLWFLGTLIAPDDRFTQGSIVGIHQDMARTLP